MSPCTGKKSPCSPCGPSEKECTEKTSCKACGMPMRKDVDFGSNADGSKNKEFCRHCMKNGQRA